MIFNSSIGIDISARQACAVHLKGDFKGVNLVAESRCLLDESKSRQDIQADIADFINGFIREAKFSASELFIGVSSDGMLFREIEFPLAVKENLRTTLSYEIEKYIPFPAEDIYFDYQIIAEDKSSETLRLLLTAVKKDALKDYLEMAERIEAGVSGIEAGAAGAAGYYFYQYPETNSPAVILVLRESGADVLMVMNRALLYVKAFAGANEAADALLAGGHLARMRDACFGGEKSVRLVLYGGRDMGDVMSRLSAEFSEIIAPDISGGIADSSSVSAFGLALKGVRQVPVQMNLMPVALRKKPNRTGLYIMAGLAGLLILSCVLWVGSLFIHQRQVMKSLESESARLKTEAAEVEQLSAETRRIKGNLNYLRSLRPGDIHVIEILKELSDILPNGAWITNLNLSGDKLSIYGKADSASELISIIEKSPLFMDAVFLSAIRNSGDGKEEFRIGCNIQANG